MLDRDDLIRFLDEACDCDSLELIHLEPMGGGAIQEHHALEIEVRGGPHEGRLSLVARFESVSPMAMSRSKGEEFAVLAAVREVGVCAPEPLWLCEDPSVLGRPFLVMRRLPGRARGSDLVGASSVDGDDLVAELGAELGRLHGIRPPWPGLEALAEPGAPAALARVAEYRRVLDELGEARPALEWVLRWLERRAPRPAGLSLCHGDFRAANCLVQGSGLEGILDWEFALWSDPYEDLGWFCARCWRHGAMEREAGGLGGRDAFYRGYEATSAMPVDDAQVAYWEVMATARWAVIALLQGRRVGAGDPRDLELALVGRKVPGLERDMLAQIEAIRGGDRR